MNGPAANDQVADDYSFSENTPWWRANRQIAQYQPFERRASCRSLKVGVFMDGAGELLVNCAKALILKPPKSVLHSVTSAGPGERRYQKAAHALMTIVDGRDGKGGCSRRCA